MSRIKTRNMAFLATLALAGSVLLLAGLFNSPTASAATVEWVSVSPILNPDNDLTAANGDEEFIVTAEIAVKQSESFDFTSARVIVGDTTSLLAGNILSGAIVCDTNTPPAAAQIISVDGIPYTKNVGYGYAYNLGGTDKGYGYSFGTGLTNTPAGTYSGPVGYGYSLAAEGVYTVSVRVSGCFPAIDAALGAAAAGGFRVQVILSTNLGFSIYSAPQDAAFVDIFDPNAPAITADASGVGFIQALAAGATQTTTLVAGGQLLSVSITGVGLGLPAGGKMLVNPENSPNDGVSKFNVPAGTFGPKFSKTPAIHFQVRAISPTGVPYDLENSPRFTLKFDLEIPKIYFTGTPGAAFFKVIAYDSLGVEKPAAKQPTVSYLGPAGTKEKYQIIISAFSSFAGGAGAASGGGGGASTPQLDTDNDGLPDAWEKTNFGNLNAGPNDDPDGDGCNNSCEYLAGTDPNDPTSKPTTTPAPSPTPGTTPGEDPAPAPAPPAKKERKTPGLEVGISAIVLAGAALAMRRKL